MSYLEILPQCRDAMLQYKSVRQLTDFLIVKNEMPPASLWFIAQPPHERESMHRDAMYCSTLTASSGVSGREIMWIF